MCRWIAYQGAPAYLDGFVTAPAHSLVAQALHADEAKSVTNGDGFGLGWYGEREVPGLYREVRPAWSDENLKNLCAQVRSHLFFAHVRASTGGAVARSNCHPFVIGSHMFMHNGQVGDFCRIRRQIEALIDDAHYANRVGTTDSEALFLALLSIDQGLLDPVTAVASLLRQVLDMMHKANIVEALRFTAALSDGDTLYGFRWASDAHAPSLYWREGADHVILASEPLDAQRNVWQEVPKGCALIARKGHKPMLRCMNEAMQTAA